MDFSSSFKKSFKSHGSYKQHSRKISAGGGGDDDSYHEEQPILYDHPTHEEEDHHQSLRTVDFPDRREVIVKIDGIDRSSTDRAGPAAGGTADNKIWRETSYEFWKDGGGRSRRGGSRGGDGGFNFQQWREDPPSKLIGQFLNMQRSMVDTEKSLDMDLEMDELRCSHDSRNNNNNARNLLPVAESPTPTPTPTHNNNNNSNRVSTSKDLKVSFQSPKSNNNDPQIVEKRHNDIESSDDDDDDDDVDVDVDETPPPQYHNRRRSSNVGITVDSNGGEVLRCTSLQRRQSMLRTKTKSRLTDQPDQPPDRRSGRVGKSGQLRSGMLGRASAMLAKPTEEEEDDPLFDEDLPEEYMKGKLSALTLLQWVSLIFIVGALVCSLSIHRLKRISVWGLHLWKWNVLVLVLICGRLVSGWGIRIVVFFFERNFLLRKRVLYFVYGVRKPVQNCIWLGLVLISWHYMFDKKVERETNSKFLRHVNSFLICMLVGTLLWLVKTLMVKVLASSFHVSTFFDRIQESLFNQYVIETLSGSPLIEMKNIEEDEERTMAEVQKLQNAGVTLPPDLRATAFPSPRSGRTIGGGGPRQTIRTPTIKHPDMASYKNPDEGIRIDHLHRLSPKNISAWNMKRLMKIVRHGVLSTLDEQLMASTSTNGDESTTQIRSEFEAIVAARKIFRNVARYGSKYIFVQDLMRFMREDEALKTMNLLGGSPETEKITKCALKNWVVNAVRERRALALTLNDTKTAVNTLHKMVNVLVVIIIVVVCLVITGIATSKFLLFLSSQVVVVAFVFGNTCKTVFESLIFMFVMHPFDVGDRCEIDGVQMVVEEMNILTTVFLRYDNQKIIFPNSTLSTRPISNYYRSPDMGDAVEFCVHIVTPAEKIAIMKQRIISFVESKKDHWYTSPLVVLMDMEELNRLKMSVWLRHRMNHQDMGERWSRRAMVIEEMVKIFKELDIEYRLLPLDINIRSMPPANSTRLPPTWAASSK